MQLPSLKLPPQIHFALVITYLSLLFLQLLNSANLSLVYLLYHKLLIMSILFFTFLFFILDNHHKFLILEQLYHHNGEVWSLAGRQIFFILPRALLPSCIFHTVSLPFHQLYQVLTNRCYALGLQSSHILQFGYP